MAALAEADTVLAAIVGAAGLEPTLAAARAGKRILLANKEALVIGGAVFMEAVRAGGATLLPIDSEHNAIFQCLPRDYARSPAAVGVRRILLTGSGGPFRERPVVELAAVTPDEACAHPNWSMGRKISVDSATMMNKGLEVIEAHWLFGASRQQIEVVIHPQSVIHSLVEYVDGSVLAQLGHPDMRTPIAQALAYPDRIDAGIGLLDLAAAWRAVVRGAGLARAFRASGSRTMRSTPKAPRRRCSMPPTRSRSPRSWPAPSATRTSRPRAPRHSPASRCARCANWATPSRPTGRRARSRGRGSSCRRRCRQCGSGDRRLMDILQKLLAFLVVLSVLVVIHELGHYCVARWCGVKVLRFSVGFGRVVWSRRYGPDRTEWALSAVPLGGYVKMADEREGEIAPVDLPRAFNRQSVGKRIAIVAAGPIANLLLAVLLFAGTFVAGVPGQRALLAEPPS